MTRQKPRDYSVLRHSIKAHPRPLDKIDAYARKWQQERAKLAPGFALCIRDDNGVVFNKAYGVSDLNTGEPLTGDLLFPIASQSKTFTALAVLQLVRDGKVSLQDKITEQLPQLDVSWLKGKTLEDALAHRTLLRGGEQVPVSFDHLRENGLKGVEPAEQPGYSNRMYNWLGVLVENISGKTFNQYVREDIVEAHNLGNIYPSYNAIPEEMRKRIPSSTGTSATERPDVDAMGTAPSGGFFATHEAISGFYHKLAKGDILPGTKVDRNAATGMFAQLNRGSGWGGLGILIQPTSESDNLGNQNPYHVQSEIGNMSGHTGSIDGYLSETRHNPETGLTISIMRTGHQVPSWGADPSRAKEFYELLASDARQAGTAQVMAATLNIITAPKGPRLAPASAKNSQKTTRSIIKSKPPTCSLV